MKLLLLGIYNILLLLILPFFFIVMFFMYVVNNKRSVGFFNKLFPFLDKRLRKQNLKNSIWIHAVSLGELKAASNFINLLVEETRAKYPICISTTTKTGYDFAERHYKNSFNGVHIFYFPYDFFFSVKIALKIIKPTLFVCVETEIWPNIFNYLKKEKASIAIINARMSDKSFKNYLRFRFFFKFIFEYIDLVLCISEAYLVKFNILGIKKEKLHVTGNMKFDLDLSVLPEEAREKYSNLSRICFGGRKIVAGSTHEGEEKLILDVFKKINTKLPVNSDAYDGTSQGNFLKRTFLENCLFLAPRHPERFDLAYSIIKNYEFNSCKLSEIYKTNFQYEDLFLDWRENKGIVILVDIIGELSALYNLCDVAFVGGSMVDAGGHNLLEPLFFGKPVTFGRYVENFAEISKEIIDKKAGIMIFSKDELYEAIYNYLIDKNAYKSAGESGLEIIEKNRGVSVKNINFVKELININCGIRD